MNNPDPTAPRFLIEATNRQNLRRLQKRDPMFQIFHYDNVRNPHVLCVYGKKQARFYPITGTVLIESSKDKWSIGYNADAFSVYRLVRFGTLPGRRLSTGDQKNEAI